MSGAKVVATNSALTHYNFVAPVALPIQKPEFSVIFMAPMSAPGVKLLARASYELVAATTGSPFDYPLSSRLDENDAILPTVPSFPGRTSSSTAMQRRPGAALRRTPGSGRAFPSGPHAARRQARLHRRAHASGHGAHRDE